MFAHPQIPDPFIPAPTPASKVEDIEMQDIEMEDTESIASNNEELEVIDLNIEYTGKEKDVKAPKKMPDGSHVLYADVDLAVKGNSILAYYLKYSISPNGEFNNTNYENYYVKVHLLQCDCEVYTDVFNLENENEILLELFNRDDETIYIKKGVEICEIEFFKSVKANLTYTNTNKPVETAE